MLIMQDDEEFLREPTNQELIKELNIAKLDILEWRNKLEIAMTRLAAVTAQLDELKDQAEYVLRECKEPEALNDLDGILNKIKSAIEINRSIAIADEARLAAVTAQRDELLEAISKCLSESNACVGGIVDLSAQLGKIRAISNAAIAKCEVQNGK